MGLLGGPTPPCALEASRRLPTHWHNMFLLLPAAESLGKGFPGGTSSKEPTCQCRGRKRPRFNPQVGKIRWRREKQPLQYSCLENPLDRGPWWAKVHRVSKSWTRLKQLSMHTHTDSAIHGLVLAAYDSVLSLENHSVLSRPLGEAGHSRGPRTPAAGQLDGDALIVGTAAVQGIGAWLPW